MFEYITGLVHTQRSKANAKFERNRRNTERMLSDLAYYVWKSKFVDGSATMLTVKRSAGVTPEVNLRIPLHTGDKAYRWGDPPWIWNAGQTSPEVQKKAISGLKKTLMSSKKSLLFSLKNYFAFAFPTCERRLYPNTSAATIETVKLMGRFAGLLSGGLRHAPGSEPQDYP